LAFVLSFITAPVLAVVLLVSYFRAGRPYRVWVYSAVVAAFSPWFFFLLFWLLASFSGPHIEYKSVRPNKIAAANSHRPFSFDLDMKFEHHHSRLSPQPVAVAEL
jgi:hypothetical protein